MLLGSIMFAFGRQLGARLKGRFVDEKKFVLIIQFILGIYGGYFGGAVGIMMMAGVLLGDLSLEKHGISI